MRKNECSQQGYVKRARTDLDIVDNDQGTTDTSNSPVVCTEEHPSSATTW
jgi:hypothetical protein